MKLTTIYPSPSRGAEARTRFRRAAVRMVEGLRETYTARLAGFLMPSPVLAVVHFGISPALALNAFCLATIVGLVVERTLQLVNRLEDLESQLTELEVEVRARPAVKRSWDEPTAFYDLDDKTLSRPLSRGASLRG